MTIKLVDFNITFTIIIIIIIIIITGLKLNTAKCDIIMDAFSKLDSFPIFKDFIRIAKDNMTLIGAPILQGKALDEALQGKVDDLQKAISRLKLLRAHDALVLL